MKIVAGIILLLLLLCNMLGLSIAVLCIGDQYQSADHTNSSSGQRILKAYVPSVPYANTWEENEGNKGLYRIDDQLYNVVRQIHQNDTLYVTLQVNASAWERFTELSEMMQQVNTDQEGTNPASRTIKLLNNLSKVYLPFPSAWLECDNRLECRAAKVLYADIQCIFISQIAQVHFRPPETV